MLVLMPTRDEQDLTCLRARLIPHLRPRGSRGSEGPEISFSRRHAVGGEPFKEDGARDGDVEAVHASGHGDSQERVAQRLRGLVEPIELASKNEGRARGVRLEGGEEIRARAILANTDPKRTFLGMVGREYLDEDFADDLAGRRVPIVSVHDGEEGLVDNIGSIVGTRQICLAVRRFSKCGTPGQIFSYQNLSVEDIVEACGQALIRAGAGRVLSKASQLEELL